jgi:Na+-translocating ferredoxin:NAD+ oxidoreductase subunit B
MHTILPSQCTGCELCVPACPVECISMIEVAENVATWKWKYPIHELKKAA